MSKFCPSLMCVDFSKLETEIKLLEESGVDMFHIDIMDGNFVPNFALGLEDIKAVSKLSKIPYDVHLMISNPSLYIEKFSQLGCQIIYVHVETLTHIHRTLNQIKSTGKKVGVAINPGTPLCVLEDVLDIIDVVLIMSVNPGFAGQPFIYNSIDRVKRLSSIIKDRNLKTAIAIDGAINSNIIKQLLPYVEYFILGTAGLFIKNKSYKQTLNELRNLS
ncbi:ribulose-phosphate 3-epimerase [Gilliamella bombicola]|uniref:Ribulose-phosphate 3-epimerase n=1 Tax=Gilliamella bombicola TaxID=1798182 RepID=A0A1C4DK96_9GAMM|nr:MULTISPECIES: ribulose-phosphate 3-epimerase [Gilliamella]NUF28549.1 ribulose-phosphate 3-epimerase [Gilliamella sp. ESL0254]SCC31702.1 ribulose-phosphate 3-epimerase [Gilliamella bombicola]